MGRIGVGKAIVEELPQLNMYCTLYMLSAKRLCEMPLEIRVLVARMDVEVYIRMYLYDLEFRAYANNDVLFKKLIMVKKRNHIIKYTMYNIEYHKYLCGTEFWYKDNMFHRLYGPAVVFQSYYKAFFQHGRKHRLDGPAVVCGDGTIEYWEYGLRIDK